MSRWYLLNHHTFCFQSWYCDASLWVGVSCKKIDLLFSRSRSLQELIWSKYFHFYRIFWTADPFATKLDWFAVFKVNITVKDNIIIVWLFNILFELLILLQLTLVWWHFIIRWIVLWKDWIALLWSSQGHGKGSQFPWMLIWIISPQLLNLL